jgi:hypothetical protein
MSQQQEHFGGTKVRGLTAPEQESIKALHAFLYSTERLPDELPESDRDMVLQSRLEKARLMPEHFAALELIGDSTRR